MTDVEGSALSCSVARPTGRRFYVHQDSLIALITARADWHDEVVGALVVSSASRAAAIDVEDALLFGSWPSDALVEASTRLHERAAADLADVFQSLVHFDPPDSIETLLAQNEQVTAWCYEGGYFTYATDETSAQTMYLETGSLRELRSQIRREPLSDPQLKMITGPSLFLVDQRLKVGRGKVATHYRAQHRRLLRSAPPTPKPANAAIDQLAAVLDEDLAELREPEAKRLRSKCFRHAMMTLRVLGIEPDASRPEEESDGAQHQLPVIMQS